MQNYYFQYAKGITSSLLGEVCDFTRSFKPSLRVENVCNFQSFSDQLEGLKCFYEFLLEIDQQQDHNLQVVENPSNESALELVNSKVMINSLISMLTNLIHEDGKLDIVLNPYLDTLNTIQESLPNLSSEQVDLLNILPKEIGETLTPIASKNQLQSYWSDLLNIYNTISNNLLTASTAIQKEVTNVDNQISNVNSLKNLEQNVFNGFQEFIQTIQTKGNLSDKPESNIMYQSLLNSCLQEVKLILSFRSRWESFGSEKNEVNEFLINLLNTPLTEGNFFLQNSHLTYAQFIIIEWAHSQLMSFCNENNKASQNDVANYLSGLASNISTPEGNTFFDVLSDELKVIAKDFSQNGVFSSWGVDMGQSFLGLVLINPNFAINVMIGLNSLVPSLSYSLSNLSKQINHINNNLQTINQQLLKNLDQLNIQLSSLNITNQNYFPTLQNAQEQFILTLSLQTAFAVVMLDKFLPEQEYYLRMLCNELYYTDQAGKYLNLLLGQTGSFYNSSIYYSLTRYLNQMNLSSIPNAVENARNALQEELSRCIDDLSRINSMKSSLKTIQSQVQSDSKLSDKDKTDLLNKLDNYSLDFDAATENLLNLKTLLSSLTIIPNDTNSNSKAFTVQGPDSWSHNLSHLENMVINGDQKLTHPGGLQSIQTQLESDQQGYSNENQDQQLVLQMELAAVQQQWTIMTTSLHIINQIYSGLVNKISAN